MECSVCAAERTRRCRVMLPGNCNDGKHLVSPFAQAPYVHPFNAPRYHAQILRTINYAKATNRRLLWLTARDTPLTQEDKALSKSALEKQKTRWLQRHDRDTAGIMGILPLVHDMPVRFTHTEDREKGVYKNSRGRLRGLLLPEEEKRRLDDAQEAEIVLRLRP